MFQWSVTDLLLRKTWHMYHEVHFWYDTLVGVQLLEVCVVKEYFL